MAFRYDAETGLFNEVFVENADLGLVIPLMPAFQNLRLSSQQGLFLLNCNLNISFERSLSKLLKESNQWPIKLIFPVSLRQELLKRLLGVNIHPVSMYPDIAGLAKFLALKLDLFGADLGTPPTELFAL